jgi:hypothetical protein
VHGGHFENCINDVRCAKYAVFQYASVDFNVRLCNSLFRRYCQICEICEEKQPVAPIFKIVFMLLDNHNMQLGNTLLVIPIWHPYEYQLKNYGQKFEICDGNQLLAAIL